MTQKPPLILASSSPRRLSLLKDIGIVPDAVLPADMDETPLPRELPRALALRLACEKGRIIAAQKPNCYVLSGDTVVACGRRILPKAESVEQVIECLSLLQGRRHQIYTGVALSLPDGRQISRVADSTVTFRQMSHAEIVAYAACGEGVGKAGGYAIQGRASAYIRAMSGSHSCIMGLPLFDVAQMLRGAGYLLT
ncbi:MAG: septum formation protein Maf [Alphaproteobacteria bacterium]|nr:septum formation protein Maf [Alphaproteobacteria bacterium]